MHTQTEDANDAKAASSRVQEVQCMPRVVPISQKDVHATHSPARPTKCIANSIGCMTDSDFLAETQHIVKYPLAAAQMAKDVNGRNSQMSTMVQKLCTCVAQKQVMAATTAATTLTRLNFLLQLEKAIMSLPLLIWNGAAPPWLDLKTPVKLPQIKKAQITEDIHQ